MCRSRDRPDRSRFPTALMAGAHVKAHPRAESDVPRSVGDRRAMEEVADPVLGADQAEALFSVEFVDRSCQCTILDSGNSMMSVAPWSLSAGIRMLISAFGTTVSTA